METTKRVRSLNWTEYEKRVLRTLVLQKGDIIENKDTSTSTNIAKRNAWAAVLARFNATNRRKRDLAQLQNQWRNLKNRLKKKSQMLRRAKMLGGLEGADPPSPCSEDLELGGPPQEPMESNCYSSDAVYIKQEPTTETSESEQETSDPVLGAGPLLTKTESTKCCVQSHAHQLFLLASAAKRAEYRREREAHEYRMMSERETHERRLGVIALEEEYWRAKLESLK